MKKLLRTVLVVVLCIVSVFPTNAFAVNAEKIQWYDVDFSDSEIQRILDLNPQNDIDTRASDLILTYNVAMEKDGSKLKLIAKMVCDIDVVKCGFKKILIQRRTNANVAWSTCLTFEDLYDSSSSHIIGKVMSVPAGYQYRAVCTFYAKRSLLSTQTITHNSNIVTF